ncbi:hypothetical protein SPRG_10395 [Saprolegnia parasitica CBS 223.65]|uniref:SAM domain-containing protein n=1 Tax=Saprolegnia parasitica (strain CBS 223.65) TaxID=695850 RepID=A0A067C5A2_SAPPC|nr:hypothetical protein SPRG_10395 [Saprolegnia parasitica CBS 223.65]KDO24320.1 hypothetical protein SPRG_10395 [Saprolegnia parasitica CBS 223.65]|eukprot:XP_012204917.1 hypothetical protein SPRG_10395 [Saprolegnia parasitica CBS 223.65]
MVEALIEIALTNDVAMLDALLQTLENRDHVINGYGKHDRTALMLASAWHAHHSVHLLLRRGADGNLKDPDGTTALHLAAENNAKHCLHQLVHANVLLDEQNVWGWTALHMAAAEGALECTKALLIAGARTDILAHETNDTPLDVALTGGHAEVVALLRRWDPVWSSRDASAPRQMAVWSTSEVADFLRSLSLAQYLPAFEHTDGLELQDLYDERLSATYGMHRAAHRLRLLEAIVLERLRQMTPPLMDSQRVQLPRLEARQHSSDEGRNPFVI